jgi:hypothetical protein
MSAAHKKTARGYQEIGRGYSAPCLVPDPPETHAKPRRTPACLHVWLNVAYGGKPVP